MAQTKKTWNAADERRVAQALAVARDSLAAKASDSDIVMAALKGAHEIGGHLVVRGPTMPERRCLRCGNTEQQGCGDGDYPKNDAKGRRLFCAKKHKHYCLTSAAPALNYSRADLTSEEREDILEKRFEELRSGEPLEDVFGIAIVASPQDEETMWSVHRVFRSCVVGRNPDRDWRILLAFSQDKSPAEVGRSFNLPQGRAEGYRDLQLAAIWTQVKWLVPEPQAMAA